MPLMYFSITSTAATIARIAGIKPPQHAESENSAVIEKAAVVFGGRNADRVFLYNPDAIANWLFRKYTQFFTPALIRTSIQIPVHSVMPSVTPVCFASMYTGAKPEIHGIQAYVKPVVKTETLFDAYIKAGKKPVIVATEGDSMSKIFLERKMDYYFFDTPEKCNKKAVELIRRNEHDLIVLYNGNYDYCMHRNGPEAKNSLGKLRKNIETYAKMHDLIRKEWKDNNTLLAFLPDHGCHELDGKTGGNKKLGSHGLDMPEDMEIVHMYGFKAAG